MVAEFRGAPPHDLGTAELAMARGVDEDSVVRSTCSTIRIVRRIKCSCGWRLLRRAAGGSAMGRRGTMDIQ